MLDGWRLDADDFQSVREPVDPTGRSLCRLRVRLGLVKSIGVSHGRL